MSIGGECRPLSQPTQRVNTRARTFFLLVSYRPLAQPLLHLSIISRRGVKNTIA